MEEVPGMLSDMNDVRPEHVEMKCVYEDIVYNDGDNWKATHVNCQMCSCNRLDTFQNECFFLDNNLTLSTMILNKFD